ncbi:MAG: RNB domain-containing ribonuclease, partial [Bacteroidetes bacterium]
MSKKKKIKSLSQLSHFILETFKKNPQKQLNYKQVSKELGIKKPEIRKIVAEKLEELAEKGKLEKTSRGKFKLKLSYHYLVGQIDFTQTGNAYVIVDDLENDVFVNKKHVKNALPEDTVKIRVADVQKSRKRTEGEVVEVLRRNKTEFVGTAQKNKNFYFVVPDKTDVHVDFYVPDNKAKNAKSGEKVIVRLVDWPEDAKNPIGEIIEVLGTPGNNEVEAASILIDNGFTPVYPKEVIKEAEKIPLTIPEKEIKKRRDFRQVTTFTIDPDDAKDFDDALSVQFLDNGNIEVGVHIADVTHYIPEGSALDKEALKRSTSVYLVDRVIPMLPEVLSNEVCSLKPHEDKLCFSAVFTLDKNAKIVKEWFGKTIIHSDRRFTYDEAQQVIETGQGDFAKELAELNRVAKILRENRKKEGSITFDKIEV